MLKRTVSLRQHIVWQYIYEFLDAQKNHMLIIIENFDQRHFGDIGIQRKLISMTRQNLLLGFPTKQDSNQLAQLQRLARKLNLRSYKVEI